VKGQRRVLVHSSGMVANAATTVGAGGVLLSTLMGTGLVGDFSSQPGTGLQLEERFLDSGVLIPWDSEAFGSDASEPLSDECSFFNFTTSYNSEFCEPFAVTRIQSSVTNAALSRATRCAAKHTLECVLSSEVGFSVPAAFVADHTGPHGMREFMAPKIIGQWTGELQSNHTTESFVRIYIPGDSFSSRTVRLNDTLLVEYMTKDRRMKQETIGPPGSFCVSLLRVAFSNACWETLDGNAS
jgi:hypothetical protein